MSEQPPKVIAGIRFTRVGKIYYFDATHIPDIVLGDRVVVDTIRGSQIGIVEQFPDIGQIEDLNSIKPVDRKANPRELLLQQVWAEKEFEALEFAKARAVEEKLEDVKFVDAEYSYDGKKLTLSFSSESDQKVDLKKFRSSISKHYLPTQLEIRQIGPRDVAKLLGGLGACGLEERCCCKFLTDFNSISIKMAKEQNVSLTPTEITGICGRLRCCLFYEYEQYVCVRKKMPKRNKMVKTPLGEGKVVEILTLKESVVVEIPESGRKEFPLDQISFEAGSLPAKENSD